MAIDDMKKADIETEHAENIEVGSIDKAVDEVPSIEEAAASRAAWLISVTVSLGGLWYFAALERVFKDQPADNFSFLFGYDTGYISSVLVTIGTSLGHELSSSEHELVTSLTSGGALIGAVGAGLTADRFGRKMPIWAACVVFVIGTALQTAAYSVAQFAVGRFVVGLGVGSAAMVVPLYIGELAPAKYRGRMVAFNNMSVTFGQLVASALGAGFATVPGESWRATVGIGAAPAILLAGMLLWCPESPRQLVAHGRTVEADQVLLRLYPTSTEYQRQQKMATISASCEEATENSMSNESVFTGLARIFTNGPTFRAVFTACVVMAISQLGGFNTLMYYSATLFSIVGFNNATAVAITVSGTNFVFSILNLVLVDKFGRRRLLTVTVLGMAICMLVAAVSFSFIPINLLTLEVESTQIGWPGTLVLVTIICYVGFYSTGVATIAWIGTELMPMDVRALGTSINTVTCWSTNIIISSTFLSMMKGITPSGAFGFYCGICFVGWLFIVFFYPDVKGMPLETIREVFEHGFGRKYSKQWQREHKHEKKKVEAAFGH